MSENIPITNSSPLSSGSDLGGDSSPSQGSDLEGRAQPTDIMVGRSDPIGNYAAPSFTPKKFPVFSVLLLIILSIVSVIAVYLFLQVRQLSMSQPVSSATPSPTPDSSIIDVWKTYENNGMHLSFSYPSSWLEDTKAVAYNNGEFVSLVSTHKSVIRVMYFKNSSKTISEYLSKMDKESAVGWENSPAIEVIESKMTVIGGFNAIQRKETLLAAGFTRTVTYFKYRDGFYMFTLDPLDGGLIDPVDIEDYDHILVTLRFFDSSAYTCPASGYADCMPSPDGPKPSCSEEAMDWYKTNCPDFKGAAL